MGWVIPFSLKNCLVQLYEIIMPNEVHRLQAFEMLNEGLNQ